mmetsp:Transcript_40825/g.131320  ORF Transcript_40825/g.131320 Transcript_40825/m.131320 type:complete len:390 (+) Transcript_40825:612-1781(+)
MHRRQGQDPLSPEEVHSTERPNAGVLHVPQGLASCRVAPVRAGQNIECRHRVPQRPLSGLQCLHDLLDADARHTNPKHRCREQGFLGRSIAIPPRLLVAQELDAPEARAIAQLPDPGAPALSDEGAATSFHRKCLLEYVLSDATPHEGCGWSCNRCPRGHANISAGVLSSGTSSSCNANSSRSSIRTSSGSSTSCAVCSSRVPALGPKKRRKPAQPILIGVSAVTERAARTTTRIRPSHRNLAEGRQLQQRTQRHDLFFAVRVAGPGLGLRRGGGLRHRHRKFPRRARLRPAQARAHGPLAVVLGPARRVELREQCRRELPQQRRGAGPGASAPCLQVGGPAHGRLNAELNQEGLDPARYVTSHVQLRAARQAQAPTWQWSQQAALVLD